MSAQGRYWQAIIMGGQFYQSHWDELVAKAASEEQEEQRYWGSLVFDSRSTPTTINKVELVYRYPGTMVVNSSDVLGAEAEIARLTMELEDIMEVVGADLNEIRRSRMLATIERVKDRLARRDRTEAS